MNDIQALLDWGLNPNFITPEFLRIHQCSSTLPWRFISKVTKTDSCWLWTAAKDRGYGVFGRGPHGSVPIKAHVASWLMHFGEIPKETPCVLHNCPGGDNPSCVRPQHLWLGTHADNARDTNSKGRMVYPPHVPGEKSPCAKLTWSQRDEILRLYAMCSKTRHRGEYSSEAIGTRFGVTGGTVRHIVRGLIWKDAFHP